MWSFFLVLNVLDESISDILIIKQNRQILHFFLILLFMSVTTPSASTTV